MHVSGSLGYFAIDYEPILSHVFASVDIFSSRSLLRYVASFAYAGADFVTVF